MKIFVSAGEASGDAHAASLVRRLREVIPHVQVYGISGPSLREQGCVAVEHMESLNVMGISEVVRSLPRIRRVKQHILNHCTRNRPDVAVLVDFPGFHMQLGASLRGMGIPVIQYIAPKLWAWGAWRLRRLRRSQDRIASILPFEEQWFAARGLKATYVGNPSAYACATGWTPEQLRQRVDAEQEQPVVALLPGSRPQEIARHRGLLEDVAALLQQRTDNPRIIVPRAGNIAPEQLAGLSSLGACIVDRMEPGFSLRGVDAAVAVSGTATLELALWGVPTVLVYRASPLTALMARRLLQVRHVGLANILMDDQGIMPELLQETCTVENILRALDGLLDASTGQAEVQLRAFDCLRKKLGQADPAIAVVDMVRELARA